MLCRFLINSIQQQIIRMYFLKKSIFQFIVATLILFNSGCSLNASISKLYELPATIDGSSPSTPPDNSTPDAPPVSSLLSLTVLKTYPTNGSRFFSYIKGYNGGSDIFTQPDVACDGLSTDGNDSCIHGGDKLKVIVNTISSCNNLKLSDSIGAFEWICKPLPPGVVFYSVGFKIGKGLSDIIDFNLMDWRNNSVSLSQNTTLIGTSSSVKWWSNSALSNPIVPIPDSLTTTIAIDNNTYLPGTVLVTNSNLNSSGLNINANSIGLVTSSNATISFIGTTNNCSSIDGEIANADYKYLICTGGQKYNWIEGNFKDGATSSPNSDSLIGLINSSYTNLNKITILKSANYEALYFTNSKNIKATNINIQNIWGGYYSFAVNNSSYNQLNSINIANSINVNYYSFIYVEGSYNIVSNVKTHQSAGCGVEIQGNNTIVTNIIGIDNRCALRLSGNNNTASHIMAHGGGIYGAFIEGQNNTINQSLIIHSSTHFGTFGDNHIVSQMAIYTSADWNAGLDIQSNNTRFTNNILIHDSAHPSRCLVSGSAVNPGTSGTTCGNQGMLSDASWYFFPAVYTLDFQYGFATSDSSNASDINGTGTYTAIIDWLNFENIFRSWMPKVEGVPCYNNECQIYDNRLKNNSNLFRNTSYDGHNQNDPFIADLNCPQAVDGNRFLTDKLSNPTSFLINAQEILNDGIGNDNGLCESLESCIYSPNFGVYQGEGDYLANGTCTFENGTITDVKMYAFPINGI